MRTDLAATSRCGYDDGIVRDAKNNATGGQVGDDFAASILLRGQSRYEENQERCHGQR
jgi:hypothetical protein